MTWAEIGVVIGAYLVGSISFTRIVGARVAPGDDLATTEIEVEGTEESWVYTGVSATSLLYRSGGRWMALVVLLDALKALLPTLAVRLVWPDSPVYLAVALAVVVGHIWPVWYRFQGGRGQSSILGALVAIDPLAIPIAMGLGAAVGLVGFTSVYAARNGSAMYLPLWFAWRNGWGPQLTFSIALVVVYALAIRPDIQEEIRIARVTGISLLSWRQRLVSATRDFFSTTDA